MKPFPHEYTVHLSGRPTGRALLTSAGLPALPSAAPIEFDGLGDAWSPEHLLLAAVQTCFLFTLRAVARASKLDFISLDVNATGTVDRQDGITRFTEIILRPRIVVPAGIDRDRVRHVMEKSEKVCLVTASLSTPVRMDAEITEASRDEMPAQLQA